MRGSSDITQPALADAAADFVAHLVDRRVYEIGATETVALAATVTNATGQTVYPADPWGLGGIEDHHTHFTGALFEYNTPETVKFRRKNELWRGQIAIVLDDIGETKTIRNADGTTRTVTIKAPPVEPTAIIETKPGSRQYVYAFDRVETDARLIETIMASDIAAGMCDPGATGRSRLSRLPGRMPRGKTSTARLIWANWSRRFNPDVFIAKALQVAKVEGKNTDVEYDLPVFSKETTATGNAQLDEAVAKILNAPGVTGSTEIYRQSFFIGQAIGNAQIAKRDAEAALTGAAQRRTKDGPRQAKNGLRDGIAHARPVDPHLQAGIDRMKAALDARLSLEEARADSARRPRTSGDLASGNNCPGLMLEEVVFETQA